MPLHPPLACRPSPPQGGRSARGKLFAQSAALGRAKRHPIQSPPLRGRCPAGQRGGSEANILKGRTTRCHTEILLRTPAAQSLVNHRPASLQTANASGQVAETVTKSQGPINRPGRPGIPFRFLCLQSRRGENARSPQGSGRFVFQSATPWAARSALSVSASTKRTAFQPAARAPSTFAATSSMNSVLAGARPKSFVWRW